MRRWVPLLIVIWLTGFAAGFCSAAPETSTAGMTTAAAGGPTPIAPSDMKQEYVWGPGDRGWGGGVDPAQSMMNKS
jgi:ABC-type molybdate transport system substrate-binding protein